MLPSAEDAAATQFIRGECMDVGGMDPGPSLARTLRRLLAGSLVAAGVWMIATASQWGPPAVALFGGEGILPQFATSVPFWPLMPIALGAWLWGKGGA